MKSLTSWITLAMFVVAVCLFLAVGTSQAQVIAGAGSGAALLIKDGPDGKSTTEAVGQVLAEVAYRFPFDPNGRQYGELVAAYGANVNNGQLGGILYRHFLDVNPANTVMPGLTAGFFATGVDDIPGITETTIFAGGGAVLDVGLGEAGVVTAYAELYKGVSGNQAKILRFGLRTSLN